MSSRRIKLIDLIRESEEGIYASEAYRDEDALQTVIDSKRKLGFTTLNNLTMPEEEFWELVNANNIKVTSVPDNPNRGVVFYRKGAEREVAELLKIFKKYGGYAAWYATDDETRRIGQLLGYKKSDIEKFVQDGAHQREEARQERIRQGIE